MNKFFILRCLFFTLFFSVGAAATNFCSQEQAIIVEKQASSLKSWDEVSHSFKLFSQCDDAAMAEGYSDSIARLLTTDWDQFSDLNKLALKDKKFTEFVLHHIDELMTPTQAETILENARTNCPQKAARLCKLVIKKLIAIQPAT